MDRREVARTLGMHKHTVYGWVVQARHGGWEALVAKPIPGRPPKLTAKQHQQVSEWVTGKDPRQLAFDFALWTRDMVWKLIRREFGVELSLSATGRLLRKMGLSPQRPIWRAAQSDPGKVQAWKETEYPKIAKEARKAGATVYFKTRPGCVLIIMPTPPGPRGVRSTGADQFKALAVGALRRLQRMPHIVRGFFGDPELAYIRRAEAG